MRKLDSNSHAVFLAGHRADDGVESCVASRVRVDMHSNPRKMNLPFVHWASRAMWWQVLWSAAAASG